MMGWGNHGYGFWGMGWLGGLMMILFWAAVIVFVFLLLRHLTAGQGAGSVSKNTDPLEILRERYAKGEIDTREYEERKKVLREET
jgi:putative membrane protein